MLIFMAKIIFLKSILDPLTYKQIDVHCLEHWSTAHYNSYKLPKYNIFRAVTFIRDKAAYVKNGSLQIATIIWTCVIT
jgi:hypothetical protein